MRKILCFSLLLLAGCATDPTTGKKNFDLATAERVGVVMAPAVTKLVDLGLTISGNGAIVPLNDAGSAALQAAIKAKLEATSTQP